MTRLLSMNVQYLKGIGEKKAGLLKKLGVVTVEDLLTFYPRAYEDWSNIYAIAEAPFGVEICVRAKLVCPVAAYRTNSGTMLYKTLAGDGLSYVNITFFNNRFAAEALKEGGEYLFYGKLTQTSSGAPELLSPKYAPVTQGGFLHPVYRQTENLNSKAIAKAVLSALETYGDGITENLPDYIIKKYRLISAAQAVRLIHFPRNEDDIAIARRRLIFEELLVLQLGLLSSPSDNKEENTAVILKDYSSEFEKLLPFNLTSAQKRAVSEAVADMSGKSPMRRLIQGDVGSGKTAVAADVIYTAVKNGFQCVLMAPTEVLANQHYKTFLRFFASSGIKTELLTGSVKASEKKRIKAALSAGEIDLIIGTHAVITDDVTFKRLALVVTDEQHRFGVSQRSALRNKGESPHVLVMSATPIPRTLSLIIYGDLSVSALDEKPVGRRRIKTYLVPSSYKQRLYGFIKKQLNAGRQCYIVCPNVEENDETPNRISAEELYRTLSTDDFSDYSVGLLHGKMKPQEKDAVMKSFVDGSIGLLICTVVIEVGIDVPNANLIVIENAECFGLSQLHQLRGRTGRGKEQSYCVLVSDSKGDTANQRFNILCKSDDGFVIADEDLKLRGPGDFFGNRQSGLPMLKIADLMTNSNILIEARKTAEEILCDDFALQKEENSGLKASASRLFADIS